MVSQHTEVPSPGVAAFIGFAAQAKLVQFVLNTLPFGFNPGDAVTGTQGIGVWSAKVCWLHRRLLEYFVCQ